MAFNSIRDKDKQMDVIGHYGILENFQFGIERRDAGDIVGDDLTELRTADVYIRKISGKRAESRHVGMLFDSDMIDASAPVIMMKGSSHNKSN